MPYEKTTFFLIRFSRVREILPDPAIYEDNGLRKPTIEIQTEDTYSIPSIVNAMCADGWTFEYIAPWCGYAKK